MIVAREPTVDSERERIETQSAVVTDHIGWLQCIRLLSGLKAVGAVRRRRECKRHNGGGAATETVYYLLSKPITPQRPNQVVHDHWGIESVPQAHTRRRFVMN
jgi:hypothetical protein